MDKAFERFRAAYARRVRVCEALRVILAVSLVIQLILLLRGSIASLLANMVYHLLSLMMKFSGLMADRKVLDDEDRLREVFLRETDERSIAICVKAGQPVVQWMSWGMMVLVTALLIVIECAGLPERATVFLLGMVTAMTVTAVVQIVISTLLRRYWEARM